MATKTAVPSLPTSTSTPTSQKTSMINHYISLSSQQNRLRSSIRHSPSPPLSPTSPEMSSSEPSSGSPSPTLEASFSAISPPALSLSKQRRRPSAIASIPEEDSLEQFELRGTRSETQLFDVNHEIKTTLTDLLNCESVRNDGKMRLWIQTRLMDAEMELKRQRRSSTRRRSSAPRIVLTPTDEDARRQSA